MASTPFCNPFWPNGTALQRTSTNPAENYRRASETASKSGKRIERCVISTFQIAESLVFRGDFRQWEHLLRIGD
jgi:hypothetical protein